VNALQDIEPEAWTRLIVSKFNDVEPRLSQASQVSGATSAGAIVDVAEAVAASYGHDEVDVGAIAIALALTGTAPVEDFVQEVASAFGWPELDQLGTLTANLHLAGLFARIPATPSLSHDQRGWPPPEWDLYPSKRRLARLGSLAAFALVLLGYFTSGSRIAPMENDATPPYVPAKVASALPSDAAVGAHFSQMLLRTQDGPPTTQLFSSRRPTAYDLRHEVVDSAWSRIWTSVDNRIVVQIDVAQTYRESFWALDECRPAQLIDWPKPTVSAGYSLRSSSTAVFCSAAQSGPSEVLIRALSTDPEVTPNLERIVRQLQDDLYASMPRPPSQRESIYLPHSSAATLRLWIVVVTFLPAVWLIGGLLDRAFWQRVGRRLGQGFAPASNQFDIEPAAAARRAYAGFLGAIQWATAVWAVRLAEVTHLGAYATAGILVVAVGSVGWLRRRILRRGRWTSGASSGTRAGITLAGVVIAGIFLGAALFVALFASAISALGGAGVPDYMFDRTLRLSILLAPALAAMAIVPLMLSRRVAMRTLRRQALRDLRAPVLLLRSFADDKRRVRARGRFRGGFVDEFAMRRSERFEEVIAFALGEIGPVFAVGQVGERLPPALGAVRRQLPNEEWQNRVTDWMQEAQVIVVVMGRSESLVWELRRIREMGYLQKTVVLFPPTSLSEQRARLGVLRETLELPWPTLTLDGSRASVVSVTFPHVGAPPFLQYAAGQDDLAYDCALQVALTFKPLFNEWHPGTSPDRPYPKSHTYPVGKTPAYKRLTWGTAAIALWAVNIVLVPVVFNLLGETGEESHTFIPPGHDVTQIAVDRTTGKVYVGIDFNTLARIELSEDDTGLIAPIGAFAKMDSLAVDDGVLVAEASRTGDLGGFDAASGRPLWTRTIVGATSLTLANGSAYVVVPQEKSILRLDASNGKTLATAQVDGIPWSAALANGQLGVTLYDRQQMVVMDATSLETERSYNAPRGPIAIASVAGHWIVNSALEHQLVDLTASDTARITLRRQDARIASNGQVLAITGLGQLTVISGGKVVHWELPTKYGASNPVAVTNTGEAVVGVDGMVQLYRPDWTPRALEPHG
jgi:hypothetical protein